MKTILSTLVAVGVYASAASAQTNPFTDPSLALPRSQGYEQALPRVSNDDYRQALPRGPHDEFNNPSLPLPLTDATFPDIVIATP
jgi:hypothetical protein